MLLQGLPLLLNQSAHRSYQGNLTLACLHRRHFEDFDTGTLWSIESVRGGHHRAENRRRLDARTDALYRRSGRKRP
jgi:hypothetical protein